MNRIEKVLNDRLNTLLLSVSKEYEIPLNSVKEQFHVWKKRLVI